MKKRFIVTIVMTSVLVTGCGPKAKTTQSSTNVSEKNTLGNYYLYETMETQQYLNFLETLDESKYEIVDISIGYKNRSLIGKYINHYAVTYRTIEKIEE